MKMRSEPVPCASAAGSWPSIKACAGAYGVRRNTISYHLERYGHLEFIGQRFRENRPTWGDDIWIRGKHYPSQTAAAKALGVSPAAISKAKRLGRLHTVGLGR